MAVYWSDARLQKLRELAEQGLTDSEIAAAGAFEGRTRESISMARYKAGIPPGADHRDNWKARHATRVVRGDTDAVISAPVETADPELAALWSAAEARTRLRVRQHTVERFATIDLMTDRPVALSISSDWHLSSRGPCDLEGLRRYAEAIRDTPGAWAVVAGDQLDNPIKWSKKMADLPDDLLLLGHLMSLFGRKLLAYTSGNHDDWTKQFAGVDSLKWLADRANIHYAPDELIYTVRLIDPRTHAVTARYVVATRHKYYRHSNLNPLHACWRWLEDGVGNWPQGEDGGELLPDILAVAHNHVAEVGVRQRGEREFHGARMGAWHRDGHSRQGGWPWSPPTAPTYILYPHRARPIKGFAHWDQALADLTAERAAWGLAA